MSRLLELMIPSLASWVLQGSARPYRILGDLGSISGVATLPSTMTANLLVEWEPLEAGALVKARQEYFNACSILSTTRAHSMAHIPPFKAFNGRV